MLSIKREVWDKTSIIQSVVPNATIWDLNLRGIEGDYSWLLTKLRESDKVLLAWADGSKLTMWLSNDGFAPQWNTLLTELGIRAIVGAKLTKRLKRLLSPRDIVVSLPQEGVNIEIVSGYEFTRFPEDLTPEEAEKLLDGACAIRRGFVRRIMKLAGLDLSLLKGAKGLSMAMTTELGFLKAFAFIVDDDKMPIPGVDIITGKENLKSDVVSLPGANAWFVADIFRPYGMPKTHGMFDIMLGRMVAHLDTDISFLADALNKDVDRILNGEAVTSLAEWNLPKMEAEVQSSNKVNADFAALADMTRDMVARGHDYRHFPGLMDLLASAVSNQWYSVSKDWALYPLPCAESHPFISESMSMLIGEMDLNVDRGTIRAIRKGKVEVVDDRDYITYVIRNTGGGDQDDEATFMQRLIPNGLTTYDAMFNPDKEPESFKGVIMARTPNGHREFSIFKYVDGDPVYTYTNRDGVEITFPTLPGKIVKTAAHMERDGEMVITGVGEFAPVEYPSSYGPQVVIDVVVDQLSGDNGDVGSVLNAVMLAEVVRPDLLNEAKATTEEIIDSFRQGGGAEVRAALTEYGESLISQLGAEGDIDQKVWRARSNGATPTGARLTHGFFSRRHAANEGLRKGAVKTIKKEAQRIVSRPTPLFVEVCEMFGVSTAAIRRTDHKVIADARTLEHSFRYSVGQANDARRLMNEELKAQGQKTRDTLTSEEWTVLYNAHLARLLAAAGPDERRQQLYVLANWAVCMGMPTKTSGRITDRSIINSKVWPIFVQALVNFGLAYNLEKYIAGGNPKVVSWNVSCAKCGKTGIVYKRSNYASHIQYSRVCKDCR